MESGLEDWTCVCVLVELVYVGSGYEAWTRVWRAGVMSVGVWIVQMVGPGICVWRISAHPRCTQCSILLHLMDICFLTYSRYHKFRLVCLMLSDLD